LAQGFGPAVPGRPAEGDPARMRGGYGSTGLLTEDVPLLPKPPGSIFSAGKTSFDWEALSRPSWAAASASGKLALSFGLLCCPLAFVLADVVHPGETVLLQPCSYSRVGMGGPWCEWSKAFLRGFPIIALSLLVTAVVRATALRVLFVRMLRAGIVLGPNGAGVRGDLGFLFVVFVFFMGVTHFGFALAHETTMRGLVGALVAVYVFVCLGFFIALLSVLNEEPSPSLVQVIEESPSWAREHLSRSVFLPFGGARGETSRVLSEWRQRDVGASFSDLATALAHQAYHSAADHNHWAPALWPGKVLSSPQLTDSASQDFRSFWRIFTAVYAFLQLGVLGLFFGLAVQSAQRVRDGEAEAAFALLAATCQTLAVLCMCVSAVVASGSLRFD